uniref:WAP domain-containing protein n=1 Tax=Branchiostoma floridae TaxID=7739 RepID=C3Z4S0_BRAFL|eukprot:XP_002596430.1 hypothetical protein BRAFLDRAFT_77141 [Branchiostoma floridae]
MELAALLVLCLLPLVSTLQDSSQCAVVEDVFDPAPCLTPCSNDRECPADQVCCKVSPSSDCDHECQVPTETVPANTQLCGEAMCTTDSDCGGSDKCCPAIDACQFSMTCAPAIGGSTGCIANRSPYSEGEVVRVVDRCNNW